MPVQDILTLIAIAPLLMAIALFFQHLARCFQGIPPAPSAPQPCSDLDELLAIAPTSAPVQPHPATLPALGKLYGVPGAGKWSLTRKLGATERSAVLAAIA